MNITQGSRRSFSLSASATSSHRVARCAMHAIACLVLVTAVGCDDKKPADTAAASASASAAGSASAALAAALASAPASAAATPPPSAEAAPAAPATPASSATPAAASGASLITGDAKDVVLTMKDPTKEPEKAIKAVAGGSVTVFLPDYPGTVWSIEANDKTLGKPKEEVIPGFAPGTNGHQFKWTTGGPLLKAGQKHKVSFVNKKAGDKTAKPSGTFSLTIEIT